ncbi:hypothetical protein J2T60_002305 [Natronospira proteinivora]|uniref:DUF5655 domain-containing protein n=1 Tax=Natronospira proteinivora TaxID=1807133 RepID=A0ABT1GBJ7_9GAMM|nr:hypothetical protein [Natronospira proteinivora]MCP1728305.1 hypothetical protein [Natronospira proteinivora]
MSNWKEKLKNMVEGASEPQADMEAAQRKVDTRREEIMQFIQETVLPAFDDIKQELEQYGREVEVTPGKYKARLVVYLNEAEEFSYVIRGDASHHMSFAWPVIRPGEEDNEVARAEIQRPGGLKRAFKLAEFTREGIIEDFLEGYKNWVQ